MLLIADDRETKVNPYFQETKLTKVKIERLKVADFQLQDLGEDKYVFLAERKVWKDLGSSLKDGRIWTFESLRAEGLRLQCPVVLIMEGRKIGIKRKRGGVQEGQLRKIIDTLILHHGIHVIYSSSAPETAKLLLQLAHNYQWGKTLKFGSIGRWTSEETKRLKQILTCIPGVSLMSATAILEKEISLRELFHCPVSTFAELKYPSGSQVGVKRGTKIHTTLQDPKIQLRVVQKLPSIGPKSAPLLYQELQENNWDITKTSLSKCKLDKIEAIWQ